MRAVPGPLAAAVGKTVLGKPDFSGAEVRGGGGRQKSLKGSEVPIKDTMTCQWLLGQEVPQGYKGWLGLSGFDLGGTPAPPASLQPPGDTCHRPLSVP